MGICIHMNISYSVTREEWADVYQETLRLVEAFPMAEVRGVPVRGILTRCLVQTVEREFDNEWDDSVCVGWKANGDYDTISSAEEYFLPRDLVRDDRFDEDAPDALYGQLPVYLDGYDWKDRRFDCCYSLWGRKTQGEPYHMYVLAVACLIAARLGRKAYVSGDITYGQCERAVRMANEHLDEPIAVPDWCDMDRLLERVRGLSLTQQEVLALFTRLYLGERDAAFGAYVREHFSEQECDAYWAQRFDGYEVGAVGFNRALKEYLLWGFGLERLCSLVSLTDDEGNDLHERFVTKIMDSKLHLREKDCTDVLDIDADQDVPYGIGIQFAQVFLAGARNWKVDRYIPLEEIRSALRRSIGDQCPTDEIIDAYIAREAEDMAYLSTSGPDTDVEKAIGIDPSRALNENMRAMVEVEEELERKYDIARYELLPYFETGDTVNPAIMKSVCGYYTFYLGVTGEDRYLELMAGTPEERSRWLQGQNRSILLRDVDWERIYDDISARPESFARYYPMVRVAANSDEVRSVVRAFVTNDELWSHVGELAADFDESET